MEQVNKLNIVNAPFLNVREVLNSNSNSYNVRSAYSDNTVIPAIIVEHDGDPVKYTQDTEPTYLLNVDITVCHKTQTSTQDTANEVYSLLDNNSDLMDQYNMELKSIAVLKIAQVLREKEAFWIRKLILQFIVQ